jgi:hypothetical protein
MTSSPSIEEVLAQELQQVETSRNLRLGRGAGRQPAGESLIGLAFSGGGIRSATFNLGILQALARSRLLHVFDYLSTVSGGGYIGGWLMAWMHHQQIGIQGVEARLSTTADIPSQSVEAPEVHFLRNYSGYLTPRKDLLGPDFWAFAAGRLRNTFSNQSILLLALLSLLLAPRAFVYILNILEELERVQAYLQSQYFALGLGLAFSFMAIVFIGLNLVWLDRQGSRTGAWFITPGAVQALIVVPLILSAAFFAYGLAEFLPAWKIIEDPLYRAPLVGMALYFGLWGGALAVRSTVQAAGKTVGSLGSKVWFILVTAAVAGSITGYLFIPFARVLVPTGSQFNIWHGMTFGTPAAVGIMLIGGILHIVVMGRSISDDYREWLGRLGGWLVVYALCWFFLFLIAVYVPAGLAQLFRWEQRSRYVHHSLTFTGALAWVVSAGYKLFFEKSDQVGKLISDMSRRQRLLRYVAIVAPYVYITGLLIGLSLLAARISDWITQNQTVALAIPADPGVNAGVPIACLMLFATALIFSWRVDINEFSANYLYRNRLIRFYLGASVPGRDAQPFTGFSDADNFPLADLRIPADSTKPEDARPLPIVNTCLNVVCGKEVVLRTRKARSFAFTPLYGGFTWQPPGKNVLQSAFGSTALVGSDRYAGGGITLGTSIAISSATARPNIGSYSQRPLAFLMTMFDVRRGWWIGNPTRKQWQRGSPQLGLWWVLRELLGTTTDDSGYLYLSDGGYFENLGIYELVRRRCKLIVACDVSCDPNYDFADLHNAMERCRTDFGVVISIDVAPLRPTGPQGKIRSKCHFVAGTVHYQGLGGPGTIIYIKPTLVEGDPQDVLDYGKANPDFPRDTRANQWYEERHFENYRALGEVTGRSVARCIDGAIGRV